jgi:hypothetical protein
MSEKSYIVQVPAYWCCCNIGDKEESFITLSTGVRPGGPLQGPVQGRGGHPGLGVPAHQPGGRRPLHLRGLHLHRKDFLVSKKKKTFLFFVFEVEAE